MQFQKPIFYVLYSLRLCSKSKLDPKNLKVLIEKIQLQSLMKILF